MINFRVVPCLLLYQGGLSKSVRFKRLRYVGDPVNTIRIFNDKGADEIVFLDIEASTRNAEPDYSIVERLAGECFMPMAYGGGIANVEQAKRIIATGVEKVVVNSAASPALIEALANAIGSQSVCVCIDYRRSLFGRLRVAKLRGRTLEAKSPLALASELEQAGAGEIILQCIDRDGGRNGYDLDTLRTVANNVDIPIVARGGADSRSDLIAAREAGASAAAAGSQFVFVGEHQAVLVNYPREDQLDEIRGLTTV